MKIIKALEYALDNLDTIKKDIAAHDAWFSEHHMPYDHLSVYVSLQEDGSFKHTITTPDDWVLGKIGFGSYDVGIAEVCRERCERKHPNHPEKLALLEEKIKKRLATERAIERKLSAMK